MQIFFKRKKEDYRIVPCFTYDGKSLVVDKMSYALEKKKLFGWKWVLIFDTKEEVDNYIKHMTGES